MNRRYVTPLAALAAVFVTSLALGQETSPNDPYIAFEYDWKTNFGVLIVRDPLGKPVKKQLTFDTQGQTNGMLVRIDGKDVEYGTDGGKFLAQGKEDENPSKCIWAVGMVEVTQILEIKTGKTDKLDTLLVRYVLENKDDRPHSVGIRVMIDSAIGSPDNDGVPFRYAGGSELVTTFKDFPEGTLPEWVEALEKPDQKDPGTITVMTLKVGRGLEPPSRAAITMWPGAAPAAWEIPLESFGPEGAKRDSSLVLYWKPTELQPGQNRLLGYGYGTQDKPSDAMSRPGTSSDLRAPVAAKKPLLPKSIALPGSGDSQNDGNGGSGKPPLPNPGDKPGRPDATSDGLEKQSKQAARATGIKPPRTCCVGELSVQHAQCALKVALGITPRESQIDVDGDGQVTQRDALLLLRQSIAAARDRK